MRWLKVSIVSLIVALVASSVSAGLSITKTDEHSYNFDWSDCSLVEVFQEAQEQLGLQSVAMLGDGITPKPPFEVKSSIPQDLLGWVASSFGYDRESQGSVRVFKPNAIGSSTQNASSTLSSALSSAQRMTSTHLVTSLTLAQFALHRCPATKPCVS